MSFAERAKEKEEKLTRALVGVLEGSGMDVERVSIDENNRGPDVVARDDSGRIVIEVKALKRGGNIHGAIEQVRGYGAPEDERWVVTTTDEEPWFLPTDVKIVTGQEILGKLEQSGVDREPVEWVREACIERDPPRFCGLATVDGSSGERPGGFMSAGDLERAENGDVSALEGDPLAAEVLDALDEPLTILEASERLDKDPALVESKIRFLTQVGAVEKRA